MLHLVGESYGFGESDVEFPCTMPGGSLASSRDLALLSLRSRPVTVAGKVEANAISLGLAVQFDRSGWYAKQTLKTPFAEGMDMRQLGMDVRSLNKAKELNAAVGTSGARGDQLGAFLYLGNLKVGTGYAAQFGIRLPPHSRMAVSDWRLVYTMGLGSLLVVDDEGKLKTPAPRLAVAQRLEFDDSDDDGAEAGADTSARAAEASRTDVGRACYFENDTDETVTHWSSVKTPVGQATLSSGYAPRLNPPPTPPTQTPPPPAAGGAAAASEASPRPPPITPTSARSTPGTTNRIDYDVVITHSKLPGASKTIAVTRRFGFGALPGDAAGYHQGEADDDEAYDDADADDDSEARWDVIGLAAVLDSMMREASQEAGFVENFMRARLIKSSSNGAIQHIVLGLSEAFHSATPISITLTPANSESAALMRWPAGTRSATLRQPRVPFSETNQTRREAWEGAAGPNVWLRNFATDGKPLLGDGRVHSDGRQPPNPLNRTPGLLIVLPAGESNSTIRTQGHVCVVGRLEAGGEVAGLRGTLRGRNLSHITLRFVKRSGQLYAFREPCRIYASLRVLDELNGEEELPNDLDDY
jgi:hypothetical protein